MARILVVDDDSAVLAITRRYLARAGHEVIETSDGRTAMQLVEEGSVDLCVVDIFMPEMDGMEFTIRLRRSAPDAKIIAMSGGGVVEKVEVLEIAARLGADRTLAKPFTEGELLTAVRELLGGAVGG